MYLTGLKGSGLPVMRQLPRHFVGTSAPGFVGKQWRVLLFARALSFLLPQTNPLPQLLRLGAQ